MLMTKSLVVGLLIAVGEIVNGNVRVRLLHSRFGKKRAKLISFFSGTLIIYSICWLTLPWLAPSSSLDCLIIGLVWLAIMLALDIYFGRYVFKFNWAKVWNDFNPAAGNMLGIGMLLLFLSPIVVFQLQELD
jgi:hypothetical protein